MGAVCTSGRNRQVEQALSPPETNGNDENKKKASLSGSSPPIDYQNSYRYQIQKAILIKKIFFRSSSFGIDAFSSLLGKGIRDPDVRAHLYRYHDADHNGKLNFVQFVATMFSLVAIEKNFDLADKDKNLRISNSELLSVLSNLGISEEGKIADLIMEMFDTNNDKGLDYEEFVVMFTFVKELVKVFQEYMENKSIAAKQLCKLLDDHRKEESVSKHINKLRSKGRAVKLDEFLREIAVYKFKLKKRKETHNNRHWHLELKELDPSSGDRWNDETFDPDNAKILPQYLQEQKVLWLRPKEIHPKGDLFVDGIDESDVIQGKLNDCWFLGALTLVANGLQKGIDGLFIKMDHARGYYRCRFFEDGKWKTVDIDDRLPCFKAKDEYELYFGSCLDKSEFWVPILEKAYAKLHGSYDALDQGDTCDALKDLTGSATQEIEIKNDTEHFDTQWNKILSLAQEKCLMGCVINGTHEEATSKGLYTDHTYAILKCEEVDGVRFLLIRNPWGMKEWNGDWSDGSPKWDENWKNKPFVQGFQFKDDGKFFMCFEDFVKYFNQLCVARTSFGEPRHIIKGEWNADTGKGCHINPYWYLNPRYVIKTHEPNTTIIVNLSQFDLRKSYSLNSAKIKDQGDFESIGMYMLETGDSGNVTMQLHAIASQSAFINARDTSLEYTIKTPATYVLQPCTYNPLSDTLSYTLSVYSNFPVDMEEIRTSKSHKVDGKWPNGFESTNSGKSINGPRYKVQCSQDCNIDILLVPKQKMKIGIKVSQLKKELISEIANEREFEQPSICVSVSAAKKDEYIIEPLALEPAKSPTKFDLVVFSDHVEVAHYFTPINSREQCIVCLV